jgi:hypothetical protein
MAFFVHNWTGKLVYSMEVVMNEFSQDDPAIKDVTLIITCSQHPDNPPVDASRHRLIMDSDKGIIGLDFMDVMHGMFEVGSVCPGFNGMVTSIKQLEHDDGLNGPMFKYFIDVKPLNVC